MEEAENCKECEKLKGLLIERNLEIEKLKLKIETLTATIEKLDSIVIEEKIGETFSNVNSDIVEKNEISICLSTNICNTSKEEDSELDGRKIQNNEQNANNKKDLEDFQCDDHYKYDDEMKMYFCKSTGYYYDIKSKLFYLPETKAYYQYNYAECQYELCQTGQPLEQVEASGNALLTQKNTNAEEKQKEIAANTSKDENTSNEFDSLSSKFDSLNTGCNYSANEKFLKKDLPSEYTDDTSEYTDDTSEYTNYTYDESCKMYYCKSRGYYYEPVSKVFYYPESGFYYKYNYTDKKYDLLTPEEIKKYGILNGSTFNKSIISNPAVKSEDISVKLNKNTNHDEPDDIKSLSSPSHVIDYDKDQSSVGGSDPVDLVKDWQVPEGSGMSIKDLVTEAVEQSDAMSDYTWDENSGMYYSMSTGYYYDMKKQLLYDPVEKIYYRYLPETSSYEFFYKVNDRSNDSGLGKDEDGKDQFSLGSPNSVLEVSSPESGEIVSSDSETEVSYVGKNGSCSSPLRPLDYDPIGNYLFGNNLKVDPPSVRAIILESSKLEIGSLVLFTCSGALIGKDSSNAVRFPDSSVSKVHAKLTYDNESWSYSLEDLGSQNGTFVNESRLSEPKMKSQPQALKHSDILAFGSCKMRIHIHNGHETCEQCEPGQVMAKIAVKEAKTEKIFKSKEEKEKERKQQCNRLKKKYGLKGAEYTPRFRSSAGVAPGYEDKAEIRRKTVGSENPYEKTESASTEVAMPENNKGYQMLKKLGWKEGNPLGLTKSGISEPIPFQSHSSRAGFGCTEKNSSRPPATQDKKTKRWLKAQERYFQLSM